MPAKTHRLAVLVATLIATISSTPFCNGFYFLIKETDHKCFIEEVPAETMVVGNYKVQEQDPNNPKNYLDHPNVGVHIQVKDPNNFIIMSKDYADQGRFIFNAHEPGEHEICINTNSSRWFGGGKTMKVDLDIKIGEATNDYELIKKKEHLNSVETRLYQLLAQVKQISNEQAYQREREAMFRDISESTNERVLWWSVGQALVLAITGYWQIRHLKSFFEAKKLV